MAAAGLEVITAALAHARAPMAETKAAQLLADWGHLQPALNVAAIEAEKSGKYRYVVSKVSQALLP